MNFFDEQTATDLEFDIIRELLTSYCKNETAKYWAARLRPFSDFKKAVIALDCTNELQLIRNSGLSFPRIEFEELNKEIRLLEITASVLDLEGVIRIWDATRLVNDLLLFFKENKTEYIELEKITKSAYYTKEIDKAIGKILDKRFNIKDDASENLYQLRNKIKTTKNRINKNFDKALRNAQKNGYISDIHENSIDSRRVLSINSTYKRQVEGRVMGSSKTGSLTYIEPRINEKLNTELDQLLDDERKEVKRILSELSELLRSFSPLIESYQRILCQFDFINAKVYLASKMDAVKPIVNLKNQDCSLIKAYHPLLLLKNKEVENETHPQTFGLNSKQRIMVISGPNAGGKSITLKTMGLLQLMFQSGLLISASSKSKMAPFAFVLSDIGDNQSIENQLSTYSYRLQRMKFFLKKTNKKTLLLLDEFGTGSDPELGGALAEVFFESIYNKGAYGVITTHYTNIKLKAAELDQTINANMLFDEETLAPKYHLSVGQAGSSFTFEVAELNGIPQELIKEAKNKIDDQKLKLDSLIADLQKEKSKYQNQNKSLKNSEAEMLDSKSGFENRQQHYEERLKVQQIRIERNDKFLRHGKRLYESILQYIPNGRKKEAAIIEELKKYIAIEKSKIIEAKRKKKEKELAEIKKSEINSKAKKKPKKKEVLEANPIVLGSRVRLKNSKQRGDVIELEGTEATVTFGMFKTKVSTDKLINISQNQGK